MKTDNLLAFCRECGTWIGGNAIKPCPWCADHPLPPIVHRQREEIRETRYTARLFAALAAWFFISAVALSVDRFWG